jgi:inhibitor of KinA
MTDTTTRLLPMGDTAWTVELGDAIAPETNARCQDLARRLRHWVDQTQTLGVLDVVPTFRSVTVHFDPLQVDAQALGEQLVGLAQSAQSERQPGRQWRLPVCFGGEHGADLDAVAALCACSTADVVATLTATPLMVYAMGFMPGFPYLASLPAHLQLPRRATPRTAVAPQTLAIANAMACVYPWASPGGWHLLGHMPIALFDWRDADSPALLQAGDEVAFYAIDANEGTALSAAQRQDPQFRQRFLRQTAP